MIRKILILLIVIMISCKSTKVTNSENLVQDKQIEEVKQFDCYYSSDTLNMLIAYFPEEKTFYLNNKEVKKDEICKEIENSIKMNKGVKHHYHPKSNFLYMLSIQQEIKKCYLKWIDEISIEKYGSKYENLDSIQKVSIDDILTYKMLSK